MYKDSLIALLKRMVKPALGCTEPAAIALAVARANCEVRGEWKKVLVRMSGNIFKNARGVGIPGTTESGIDFAIALALVCGKWEKGLEVFSDVDEKSIQEAHALMDRKIIALEVCDGEGNFFIEANIEADNTAKAVIREAHTNIVYVECDGKCIFKLEKTQNTEQQKNEHVPLLQNMTIKDLRKEVEELPLEDIAFLIAGVPMNYRIAKVGLEQKNGLALGNAIKELMEEGSIEKNIVNTVRMYAAAAADARMAGLKMPVMSSAGSGNHGITAILPVVEMAKHVHASNIQLVKALAFSHTLNVYIKSFTGKLSATCGCGVSAATAASAAMVWLLGGNDTQIGHAIINMSGNLTGMICDGGKIGCALKLATATNAAMMCAYLAISDVVLQSTDGICGLTPEEAIHNMGKVSNPGMTQTDQTILEIMMEKDC